MPAEKKNRLLYTVILNAVLSCQAAGFDRFFLSGRWVPGWLAP